MHYELTKRYVMFICNRVSGCTWKPILALTVPFVSSHVRKLKRWDNDNCVRFEVFTSATMNNAVFWDVASCSSCVNQHFASIFSVQKSALQTAATCSRWFLVRGFFYPEDGGDTFLQNVGSHKNYTAPHPRKRHSSMIIVCLKITVFQIEVYN
jgi:hypothetical protein